MQKQFEKQNKFDKVFTKCKTVFWPSDSRMINVKEHLLVTYTKKKKKNQETT